MKKGSKKIISKTIATALATTNLVGISSQAVNAFEKNIDTNNVDVDNVAENTVDVTVENTEKIEDSNTEIKDTVDNSEVPQDSNNEEGSENIGTTETEEVEDVENVDTNNSDSNINESNDETVTEGESTITNEDGASNSEESTEVSNDKTLEDNANISEDEKTSESEKENSTGTSSSYESKGKIELDINFPMPIINTDNISFSISKDGQKIGNITDLSIEEGTLDNGASYKIEKLNSIRKPLEEGDKNIYFLHVVFEGLELGNYSLEVNSDRHTNTRVDDIEVVNYSKRVTLSSGYNSSQGYNGGFLAGDVDGNGIIDMGDYNLVFENLGKSQAKYDLNNDGIVDIADLTYVNENIGKELGLAEVTDTDAILKLENIDVKAEGAKLEEGSASLKDILTDSDSVVTIGKVDGQAPSVESPLTLAFDLSKNTRSSENVKMDQIVIKAPITSSNSEAGVPSMGTITYEDENGQQHTLNFDENKTNDDSSAAEARMASGAITRVNEQGDVVIELGNQIAVKKISINVTGNRGNKKISEIAKIEFLNNVYKEIPKPDMNIPKLKIVETSTNLHNESITLAWEPQANVTSYEVMYQKLDDKGNVKSTKKLQTNQTSLKILDKDIKPYDLYRVSIQSLNGEWSSGYLTKDDIGAGFDGAADNVDESFNPIDKYYNEYTESVLEVRVVPNSAPEPPRNLTTSQGYKSFTVKWEEHSQARDFDIYYRKLGDTNKNWLKANDGNKEVTEDSPEVTNPDKSKLSRSGSYTITNLEDNTAYEVRVTATNHLGTSKMSSTYIAKTTSVIPPVMSEYNLINRPTDENEIGTEHIVDVRNKNDADGWGNDGSLKYDSEYALVDGDFTTSWKVNDWDTGAVYGANRGSEITFDDTYEIGSIAFAETLEQGYPMAVKEVKITYWENTENGTEAKVVRPTSIQQKTSNGNKYYIVKLSEPINAKKIKVDTAGWGGNRQTMSELRFYKYDSIADDIKALYTDDLRLVLKKEVTQETLNELRDRLNTKDPISNEYHPDKAVLEKELEVAQLLYNDREVSEEITTLDASIRDDNEGPKLGMQNDWQSLGSVARPGVDEDGTSEQIVVYMGSSDPNTRVQITFLQNYGLPSQYQGGTVTIAPGRTEITIPSIIAADVEKGGQVMARVTNGSTTADVKIRLSGVTEIPHLNVNNIINDSSKVDEVKGKIKTYIEELKLYMGNIESLYEGKTIDRENNIYPYDEQTSPLNTTDIEGDRFTLTLPASEILKGIKDGLNGDIDKEVDRVYNALLAWEQEVQVGFAKKGVFEEVKDFNKSGSIDDEDRAYFSKHRAPLTRLNVKYQRMMMGAAAYASSHHIGVGFGSSSYIQGVPYKFNEEGNVTNENEAKLYGALIGHEMGHAMDIGDRLYPETSNNLMTAITATMLNEDSPYASSMSEVYKKVTSNTIGLSTNRSVVVNMLWQPYLAYEDDITYKMLLTDNDADLSNDSFYAKLNRAYREMTSEERANGDRDQWLIRMTSKAAGRNLTAFYEAHGIIANQTTLEYVSKFPEETGKIQYINDEARRRRIAGTADMEEGTTLTATFGNDSNDTPIKDGSYVDDKKVSINLSVNKSKDKILGYEIYRNGEPCGFIEADKVNDTTVYTDIVDNINNRVVTYSAVAYDYNLKPTNTVELGTVKIRHEGGVDKSSTILTSNTISMNEESNDIHGHEGNVDLKNALDNNNGTAYAGRMLINGEYNSSVHLPEMHPNNSPYLMLDTTEMKTLVGIKYTAPVESTGFIFKKDVIATDSIKKYKIEVSKDGVNWTTVKNGELKLTPENPTATIYFDKEGVEGGNQLASYNARYVKITALGTKYISASELEVITPPGDNIEIGVADDNINYANGIGVLKDEFTYVVGDGNETEEKSIPAGSIVITGEYRGNPAFNVPLVLNQDEEHIAEKYDGLLFAQVPDNGNLEEIAEGTWIYWVRPEDSAKFMEDNSKVFAELYRTDTADAIDGGQRLVSDTFKIDVPSKLPQISFNGGAGRSVLSSNNVKVIEINKDLINKVTENR